METPQEDLSAWFERQQATGGLSAELSNQPLQLPWRVDPESPIAVSRDDGRFFDMPTVEITNASTREVPKWTQPTLRELNPRSFEGKDVTGVILLVRKQVGDFAMHLIKASAEPGNSDRPGCVLLGPSIQASFSNAEAHPGKVPLWTALNVDEFVRTGQSAQATSIQWVQQAKDGGRFYRKNNLLVMWDIATNTELEVPPTHRWARRDEIRALQLRGLGNEHLAEVFGTFI